MYKCRLCGKPIIEQENLVQQGITHLERCHYPDLHEFLNINKLVGCDVKAVSHFFIEVKTGVRKKDTLC